MTEEQSTPLSDSIGATEARLLEKLPVAPGQFVAETWSRFDVLKNLEILVDPRRSYLGHKETVQAAFIAWCIAPNLPDKRPKREPEMRRKQRKKDADTETDRTQFRKKTIRWAAIRQLMRLEDASAAVFPSMSPSLSFYLGTTLRMRHFYEQIYRPIGGARALSLRPSSLGRKSSIAKQEKSVEVAAQLLLVYHVHYAFLGENYRRVSQIDARDVAGTSANISGRQVQEYWAERRPLAAFLYAAQTMRADKGSLLEEILTGRVALSHRVLLEWLGRTRWICREVLSRADRKLANETDALIPQSVAGIPIEHPHLPTHRAQVIAAKFGL